MGGAFEWDFGTRRPEQSPVRYPMPAHWREHIETLGIVDRTHLHVIETPQFPIDGLPQYQMFYVVMQGDAVPTEIEKGVYAITTVPGDVYTSLDEIREKVWGQIVTDFSIPTDGVLVRVDAGVVFEREIFPENAGVILKIRPSTAEDILN